MKASKALPYGVGAAIALAAAAHSGYDWLKRSDFDRVCAVLTSAVNDPEFARHEPSMRAALLAERIQGAIYAPPAANTFRAINMADPAYRVQLLLAAAQEVRGSPWDCPALSHVFAPAAN